MCTNHQRSGPPVAAPTITRVPLMPVPRSSRWSRRKLLIDTGLGTAGVAIIAACSSGSDSGSAASPNSSPETEPSGSTGAVTTEASTSEVPAPEDPSADVGGTELQLQHVSLGFVSAYVLVRGTEAAIVDTGTSGSGEAISGALDAVGLAPADVRHIVLTHDHGDHVGGLGELEGAMTNATVYAGAGDIDSIQTSLDLAEVADGDEVFGMGVVATPGHTPGSISVFDTETGLVVAGDAINGDNEGGLTGANPDFTPDMGTAGESVAKLAALMPRVVAFGHGGPPVTADVAAKLAALV